MLLSLKKIFNVVCIAQFSSYSGRGNNDEILASKEIQKVNAPGYLNSRWISLNKLFLYGEMWLCK